MSWTASSRNPTTSAHTIPLPLGTMIWQTSPMTACGPRLSMSRPMTLVTRPVYLIGSIFSTAPRYFSSTFMLHALSARLDGRHVQDLLLDLVQLAGYAGVDLAEVGLDQAAAAVDRGVLHDGDALGVLGHGHEVLDVLGGQGQVRQVDADDDVA